MGVFRGLGRSRSLLAVVLAAAAFGACTRGDVPETASTSRPAAEAPEDEGKQSAASEAPKDRKQPRLVDPRQSGFEIGLGEWALAPEADAIRPGLVTFVIHNRGTMQHGFEIALEGDSSGSGSGDLFKTESELLDPGESTRMTLDLGPGVYEIECLVDGHDDMGMEGALEVSPSAPLVPSRPQGASNAVAISDFAFSPKEITVPVGTEVTWRNEDPADHTVTAVNQTFGSDVLHGGDDFAHRFGKPGTFAYRCAIHPEMKGKVRVQ